MTTVPTPEPEPFEARDPGPPPADIDLGIELVTPEKASEMLRANPFNRRKRQPHIQKLAGAMARGEFRFNGDPFRISEHGDLLDGQHRCEAVIESGQSIWSVVIRGLPGEVIHTIDTDMAPRNLRDVLKIGGELHYDVLATAIMWKWRKETNVLQTKDSPTPAQALAMLDKHEELRETSAICSGARALKALKMNKGLLAALLYEFRAIDPEDAECEVRRLSEGTQP